MSVRTVVALVLLIVLAGCGTASAPSPPTGVDELTIPTPTPDPADFVERVDNPWMPLETGRSWTYDVVDVAGTHPLRVTVAPGPDVDGVATTAQVSTEQGRTTTDWFAQDRSGNVWWFGREGEWRAGEDGAEAGLAMPAHPRVGDGFRTAYAAGVVEDVATVAETDGVASVPAGSYEDLVVIEVRSDLGSAGDLDRSFARGIGLVEEERTGRTGRLSEDSG